MGMPAPQTGRADLLASIQGKGIHTLKKTDSSGSPARAVPASPTVEESSSSGGGDLTAALATALLQRKNNMGDDSDEEEEEDDWD